MRASSWAFRAAIALSTRASYCSNVKLEPSGAMPCFVSAPQTQSAQPQQVAQQRVQAAVQIAEQH